ncbi:transcriptional regulator, TetR family [Variovorax sp. HW608]|uniref:TetR/AcrR family transcriptional regulator n=1 Tax=Variovorax sp. HW608 TaxID=1034889 RepID=UPI00081FB9A6|nr:TetR/AcrR family transcriptional regulator [Variovorax sp. HW608]SCK15165.1 transcriptional regulator, TetR family [Variovorax sp. HW608]
MATRSRLPAPDSQAAAQEGGPTRRERRRQRTEDLILEAATQVFQTKGIVATTMQDIAVEVDVVQGTLYNYFPTKEALTVAVVRRLINAFAEELAIQGGDRTTFEPLDLVAFACVAVIEKGVTDPIWRALVERYDVLVDAVHDEIREFAMANLREAVRGGAIKATEAELQLQWRLGSWMMAGAIRDIVQGKLASLDVAFDIALHVLLQKGIPPAEARRIVRKVRNHVRRNREAVSQP